MRMTKETFDLCIKKMEERTRTFHGTKADLIPKLRTHLAALRSDPSVKDADRRFIWNSAYCLLSVKFICDELYNNADLNDDHIYTAMKKLLNEFFETDDFLKFFS